jgi:hypothetical protein
MIDSASRSKQMVEQSSGFYWLMLQFAVFIEDIANNALAGPLVNNISTSEMPESRPSGGTTHADARNYQPTHADTAHERVSDIAQLLQRWGCQLAASLSLSDTG